MARKKRTDVGAVLFGVIFVGVFLLVLAIIGSGFLKQQKANSAAAQVVEQVEEAGDTESAQ